MSENWFGPKVKNIGDYGNMLYAEGAFPFTGLQEEAGLAVASPGQIQLLADRDSVINEISVGMSGVESQWKTVSGAQPLLISDSVVPSHVTSCSVSFSPQQDLHGYDSPWPAGGGKNKCNFDQTVTETVVTPSVYLTAGTYYVYVAAVSNQFNSFVRMSTDDVTYTDVTTSTEDAYVDASMAYGQKKCALTVVNPVYVVVRIQSNANISGTRVRVMITADSTKYSTIPNGFVTGNADFESIWSPYSNLCPISGWTGCEVTVSSTPPSP